MIEQLSKDLPLLGGFYDSTGALLSGLSDVSVTVWRAGSGTPVVSAQPCAEVGTSGVYLYTLLAANTAAAGLYLYKMHTADSRAIYPEVTASVQVGPAWAQHLDSDVSAVPGAVWDVAMSGHTTAGTAGADLITASQASGATPSEVADAVWDELIADHALTGSTGKTLSDARSASGITLDDLLGASVPASYGSGTVGGVLGRLGSVAVTVVSPVATDGSITIYQGDAYKAQDGRAIEFTVTTTAVSLPDLTDAVPYLRAGTLGKAGTLTTLSTQSFKASFDLTDADTAAMYVGEYTFQMEVTQADGDVLTYLSGTLTVLAPHN